MAKVDAWMAQRQEIAQQLRQVADRMMGGENPFPRATRATRPMHEMAMGAGGGGSEVGPALAAPRRKRFTMSAEARKRISEAQKARWAARKQEAGGKKARKAKSA